METASENQGMRTGLRQPSKIKLPSSPSRSNGLSELTESATNTRGATGPPVGSIKHKPTGLPEPPSKFRKTLQERAAEPYNTKLAAPVNSRSVQPVAKYTASNGIRPLSQSTSRVPSANTNLSRNASVSSFGGGNGYGQRVQATNSRPRTGHGIHARSKSHHQGRPVTSMSRHEEDEYVESKGAYNSLTISTNLSTTKDNVFQPPRSLGAKGRVVSVPDAVSKRPISRTPTRGYQSLSFHHQSRSFTPESPVYANYDEVMDSLGALSLGTNAVETRGHIGHGISAGKENAVSSFPSRFPSSLPRAATLAREPCSYSSQFFNSKPPRPSRRQKLPPPSPFLRRDTNDRVPVFDPESRMQTMEREFAAFKQKMEGETTQASGLKDTIQILQNRVTELESIRSQVMALNEELKSDLKDAKNYMASASTELETARRNHTYEADDLRRKHRNDMDDLQEKYRKDADRARKDNEETADKVRKDFEAQIDRLLKAHTEELSGMQKKLSSEVEQEQTRRLREAQDLQTEFMRKLQEAGLESDIKDREIQKLQGELTNVKAERELERTMKLGLQSQLSEATTLSLTLESANKAMKAKIDFLESDSQAQSEAFNDLHRRMQDAIEAAEVANEKLRQEEALRRKLHNQVQELKGNIRVMCRVRPTNPSTEINPANIAFPDSDTDSKEVAVQGPVKQSAMGTVTTANYAYSFDRVFGPQSQNSEIFEEISQLVQSALDGYNVCIFCYGQTGSGKTFTMSSGDGMIPRATQQIYAEAKRLEEKGWHYKIEGSFVEVYNETYNDLLGRSEDLDKKKLEIRHDPAKKSTTIENAVSVALDGPHRVEEIMKTADKNRSVAATKANSRSSRSHSVFILKLAGENSKTGERSEGTLNLVDLAGSERLEHSKVEGQRLKETQNINKSLSCLGDVINALGSAKEGSHVPYRNSKLTYLLQYSLGGNSKTLMFVMVSPLQAHLQETITSLKFATKVHNTHIGTAKKQTKTT
ncbi:P-loop containing nucleoside triphosphate hydrolase protein [Dendryphion nanum]|uniref:Kinesin-like protein n=1 Tax=Dendryphion nanum TaxID=256645 RepID=A0A9P9DFJ7_9PLEO|nr:P-loop containing nucleoside triphosphate hydrolase protein [Dendryphion nanum]